MESSKAAELCTTPAQAPLPLPASMPLGRQQALMVGRSKWVNGTVLRYAFFTAEENQRWAPANPEQAEAVREGFAKWKGLGLGLEFVEIEDLGEAEVRIGFEQGDGYWSYVGRDILSIGASERTMNYGRDTTDAEGRSAVLHELGHTLGMPHEHQSPFSGIVWNEEAVYRALEEPPNEWDRAKTFHNIIRKLDPAQVEGSRWDPDSIMEYPFEAGLISAPAEYQAGIDPPGTISPLDEEWMLQWYPGQAAGPATLEPFRSAPLDLAPTEQADFAISPPATRDYRVATFGDIDTVAVIFESVDGELRFLAGDDDGGEERNARLTQRLIQGREYVLRVRMVWTGAPGQAAVMYW